jgi:hypothetical protein
MWPMARRGRPMRGAGPAGACHRSPPGEPDGHAAHPLHHRPAACRIRALLALDLGSAIVPLVLAWFLGLNRVIRIRITKLEPEGK